MTRAETDTTRALATKDGHMSDAEEFDNNPPPLVEQLAENMEICAGVFAHDHFFQPLAEELLRSFKAIEGRPARDYLEIEGWLMRHRDVLEAASKGRPKA